MPKSIKIIAVPYHLDQPRLGMGAGPEAYLSAGAVDLLREQGNDVAATILEQESTPGNQLDFILALQQQIAAQVQQAIAQESFPLILSGNCSASIGALGGIARTDLGLIWLDGHGDFNTPATSPSGFFDGMGLAVIAGLCHPQFAQTLGGCLPLAASRLVHLGGREFDPGELDNFRGSGARLISAEQIQKNGVDDAIKRAIEHIGDNLYTIHLHLDIDVLNSNDYPANEFPAAGGLTLDELETTLDRIAQEFLIQSMTLSAYDPAYDPEGRTLRAGLQLMRQVLTVA